MKNTSIENFIKLSVSKVNFRINFFPTYKVNLLKYYDITSRIPKGIAAFIDLSISITMALTSKIGAKTYNIPYYIVDDDNGYVNDDDDDDDGDDNDDDDDDGDISNFK